jgi:glycosyltransferase involved in cell wall biosynthesis
MRITFCAAAANVFLGPQLRHYAQAKCSALSRAEVISIGADERPFINKYGMEDSSDCVDILYCGNFGQMHDVKTIIDMVVRGVPPGIRFIFRGHGVGIEKLKRAVHQTVDSSRFSFGRNLEESDWVRELLRCPVALVTLRTGAECLVMPSKTYSALMAGQAILAVCPSKSDLAELIRTNDVGWAIEPGDVDALRNVLKQISSRPTELALKRRNAARVGHGAYRQEALARQWSNLFNHVLRSSEAEVIV